MRQALGMVFAAQGQTSSVDDPLKRTRQVLVRKDAMRLGELESDIRKEVRDIVTVALRSESEAV